MPASAWLCLLLIVAAERLLELWLAQRNRRWALHRGGLEFGQRHYRWMVLLHASLLVACFAEVWFFERPFRWGLGGPMLALLGGSMALRYWTIATLGRRWNTRVLVIPGLPAIESGPYRWLRHPNYVAVVVEIVALPLVHGAWCTALLYTAANALLLRTRLRVEERALQQHSGYLNHFANLPRWLPSSAAGQPTSK